MTDQPREAAEYALGYSDREKNDWFSSRDSTAS